MKLILSLFFTLLTGIFSFAQQARIPSHLAVKDLDSMVAAIEAYHPNPFRYITESSWQSLVLETRDELKQKDFYSPFEFRRHAQSLVSRIKDEHLEVRLNEKFWRSGKSKRIYFPFKIGVLDDQRLTIKSALVDSLSKWNGHTIDSINGYATSDILETMKTCALSNSTSGNGGSVYYISTFDNFSRLFFLCIDQSNQYTLRFSDSQLLQTTGIPGKMLESHDELLKHIDQTPPYAKYSKDAKSAYLRINSFYPDIYGETLRKSKKRIDELFKEFRKKGIEDLTVDLRGNRGGSPFYSTYVAALFFDQPFQSFDSIYANSRAATRFSDKFKGPRVVTVKPGYNHVLLEKNRDRFDVEHPENRLFRGKVTVLINGGSGSASGIFCGLISKNPKVRFEVSETMGDAYQMTGGQFTKIPFEATQTRLDIPLLIFAYGSNYPIFGTKPDGVIDENALKAKFDL